ncbi:hypothetical protein HU200_064673 [Digitaria exilis]|uniref:Legume lectin domain-containing protein n=1 Tax=Digitaria exilis TaxID=1010633 RepID=A0A835DV90_9POAL|nr:hypothetical protein HU200_064673 [Digitaria exilis]
MAYSRARLILQLLLPAAYFMAMSLPAAAALSFSYNFSKPGDLEAAKLTYINVSSSSGDRVSLTANTTGSTGRVAYPRPVRLWDDRTGRRASFTTNFTFFIGNGSVNSSNEINGRGDGMAFFVGPFPATLPVDSDGAFLGLFSNNTKDPSSSAAAAVAVEFDTYKNHGLDPPNVTADHIGIDVDNITSANYTALPNLALSGVMSASIRYDAGSKMMSVSLWLADGSLYTVQARVDLKDALAGPDAAVGFSAATGIRVESHQLLSWSFSSTGNHAPRATLVYLTSNGKQKKRMSLEKR